MEGYWRLFCISLYLAWEQIKGFEQGSDVIGADFTKTISGDKMSRNRKKLSVGD